MAGWPAQPVRGLGAAIEHEIDRGQGHVHGPARGHVKGTVTLDGVPLVSGVIGFVPNNGRPAYGKVVNGEIREVTSETANDGALVGNHRVTLQPTPTGDMKVKPDSSIPQRYGDPATSDLTAEIKPGTNELRFALTK